MDKSKVLNNNIKTEVNDITMHKNRKEEIQEFEPGFRAFFDSATDGIFLADMENKRICTGNKKFCQMLGYGLEEIKNLAVTEIFEKQLRSENTLAKDMPVKKKNGSNFYIDINSALVMLGEKRYLMGIFSDAIERKKIEDKLRKSKERVQTIEEALQESREKYRALTESSGDAICAFDHTGQHLYSNQVCTKLFGKKFAGGKRLTDVFPEKQAGNILKEIKHVFRKKAPIRREYAIRLDKGLHYFAMTLAPIVDKKKVVSVVITAKEITKYKKLEETLKKAYRTTEKERSKVADTLKKKITDTRKAYAELQESKDELVRTEKLAFTGRIAASIAHEIRNPLTNVSMSVGQLMKAIKPQKPKIKHVEIITRNIERINYLITELLNCARPPKLDIQPFDIHRVLKNVLETAKPKIDLQMIKVVKKFTSKPSTIDIDREQMERAFLNLVINAVEAMSKKGRLTISTERSADFFVIKIQDTGKGIAEEDVIKVFDPFFSSKSEGVGLGLTVCYGIIVSQGGTIEVESKRKRGSVFTVSLPIGQKLGKGRSNSWQK